MFEEASKDVMLALQCNSGLSTVKHWHDSITVIPKGKLLRDLVIDANSLKNNEQYAQTISKLNEALVFAIDFNAFLQTESRNVCIAQLLLQ